MTSNGATAFVYDLANQPVTVTGAGAATYAHDGNLKRVKEVRTGKTIYTVYSRVTGSLVFRDEATDGVTTDYANISSASVRLKKTGATITPEYTHVDHLDSAIAASNASGAPLPRPSPLKIDPLDRFFALRATGSEVWREHWIQNCLPSPTGAFGKGTRTIGAAPANDNNTGFTGHLEDDASGLVYMQARYYDPAIGRFLSTDPIGYQDQLNLYAYVANDPVNATDPTGEYARGEGFTDDQWKRFDKAQQKAADRMESRATKLGQKAQKMDAKGKSGGDAMRSKAESLCKGVTALRSTATHAGYIAVGVDQAGYEAMNGTNAKGAAVTSSDGKTVTVNLGNSSWNSGSQAQWNIGHESLHSAGLKDQRWGGPTGPKAYKFGETENRDAFDAMKGTPQADINPDHIMDEVY